MENKETELRFPKKKWKKKRKIHKKSILPTEKHQCFLCIKLNNDYSYKNTEEHHILFGSGERKKSEENGLKTNLCVEHHRTGKNAVHNCKETRTLLCKIYQKEFEKTHTREEWNAISKKNYL